MMCTECEGKPFRSKCSDCKRAYEREAYARRKAEGTQKQKSLAPANKRRITLRQYIYDHYKSNPCVECGESRIACLQLDHLRDKKFKVSSMVSHVATLDALKEEIAKCRVLCANCHSVHTAEQLGWYKDVVK